MPEPRVMAVGAKEIDGWFVSYVASLMEHDLRQLLDFTFTSSKPARMQRGEMILHVCLHTTCHRGNAGAALQLRGITPSRDGVTYFLELAA